MWLAIFLFCVIGAILLGKSIEKRLDQFLAKYPDGLESLLAADEHQSLNKRAMVQSIALAVLVIAAIISLIGVTADYGGIGLIPIAVAIALMNRWFRQSGQKGKQFDQLYKEYQAQDSTER